MTMYSCDEPLAEAFDQLLMDLDGVCYLGAAPAPFAAEGMAEARRRGALPVYITNNSSRPPSAVAEHLTSLGIPTEPGEILNSAQTAVMQAIKAVGPGAKVLAIGGAGVQEAVVEGGLIPVESADDEPAVVIQGMSEKLAWIDLSEAFLALQRGAIHVATNLDATLPKERGFMIGNGSMVAAVVNATGLKPLSSGKPAPDMYLLAVEKTGAKNPLAVGDRLNTDIRGANAAGFKSLHVLTGVSDARDVMLAVDEERPSFLGLNLRDLSLPVPPVTSENGEFRCEESVASMDGNDLVVDGERNPVRMSLNGYRAAVGAVWAAIDGGVSREDLAHLPIVEVYRP